MCPRRCHGHDPGSECRSHGPDRGCVCEIGRLRGFIEACAVALLAESPAHGYDLMGRLGRFGLEADALDAGTFYRMLRRLEDEGILVSAWSTEGPGAARRVYEVTPEGRDFLHSWRASVTEIRGRLAEFVSTLDAVLGREG